MNFEFAYRTYRLYGPDPTLHTLSKWLEARLPGNYGDAFENVLIELCCKSDGQSKVTLEQLHADFSEWHSTLPQVSSHDRGRSLRVCLAVHWPTDAQLKREAGQALSLKSFHRALNKCTEAVSAVDPAFKPGCRFDAEALARDLEASRREAPSTLHGLVSLYLTHFAR